MNLAAVRRLSYADRLAALYAVAYLAWLAVRTPGTSASVAVGTVAFYPLGIAVAWANWRNYRTSTLDRRSRLAWLLLACSAFSLWVSGSAWSIYVLWGPEAHWPAWLAQLEFAQHLLAMAAYLVFPGEWPSGEGRARFLLDIGLTVVAGFVLAFRFSVEPSAPFWTFTLTSWAVDWALFVVTSVGFLRARHFVTQRVMAALLGANTAYFFGNFALTRLQHPYQSGDAIDVLWFAAWALRWGAARYAWYCYRGGCEARNEAETPSAGYRRTTFSYLMVACAFLLLLTQFLHGDRQFLAVHAVSLGAMAGLLVARQFTELQENRRLFAAQLAQEERLRHAQKLDAVGKMAGGLAHDFNNVLTAIRGYSELLKGDLSDPAAARRDLGHIEDAVDRAAAVTRKLLGLSRNQPVQRNVLALDSIVRDLLPLLRQLVTDRIDVQVVLDPAPPVKADQGQIEQVLLNLATNARDAMPAGGRLRIATGRRSAASGGDGAQPVEYAALSVSDEGEGIAPEVKARIFEPFFSTKGQERGLGLGLAMVGSIVEESGGTIEVESEPGYGAVFTILLPATTEVAESVQEPAAAPGRDRRPRTVLLVDDEPSVRAIAQRMLERRGYHVLPADGGAGALELASDRSQTIDLLLTDLVMPGLHGSDLIGRFRAVRPSTPIVCMTGFAGDADDTPGLCASVAAVVTKPFSSDQLVRVVANALRG